MPTGVCISLPTAFGPSGSIFSCVFFDVLRRATTAPQAAEGLTGLAAADAAGIWSSG